MTLDQLFLLEKDALCIWTVVLDPGSGLYVGIASAAASTALAMGRARALTVLMKPRSLFRPRCAYWQRMLTKCLRAEDDKQYTIAC